MPKTKFQPMPKPPAGVKLVGAQLRFYQDQDSDSDEHDGFQELTVKTADAGGGSYPVLVTERWAMDRDAVPWLADICKWVVELAPGWSGADDRDGEGAT